MGRQESLLRFLALLCTTIVVIEISSTNSLPLQFDSAKLEGLSSSGDAGNFADDISAGSDKGSGIDEIAFDTAPETIDSNDQDHRVSGSEPATMRGGSSGDLSDKTISAVGEEEYVNEAPQASGQQKSGQVQTESQQAGEQVDTTSNAKEPSEQADTTSNAPEPSDQADTTSNAQEPSEQADTTSNAQEPSDQANSSNQQTSDQASFTQQPSDQADNSNRQSSDQAAFTQQLSNQADRNTQQLNDQALATQQASYQAPAPTLTQDFSDQAPSTQQFNDQPSQDQQLSDQASAFTAPQQPSNQAFNDAQQPLSYSSLEPQADYSAQAPTAPQIPLVSSYNVEGGAPGTFRRIVCQNGTDTITCPSNERINIMNAEYGDMGQSQCFAPQDAAIATASSCQTPGAYESVKSNCDDMENCQLSANDQLFGDDCKSDKKYLDLTYNCLPSQSPVPQLPGYGQAAFQQPQAAPQYLYQSQQPAAPAYAPAVQGPQDPSYSPAAAPHAQAAMSALPPAPALPDLMSTLASVAAPQAPSQCGTCNTCNQCNAVSYCNPCPSCQSMTCGAPLPQLPANLQPLWQLWNEKTADMSRMEMSALIFSPVPKLPPTPKSSSVTEAPATSGSASGDDTDDYKRSHVPHKKHAITRKTKKTVHANRPVKPLVKHVKSAKRSADKTSKKSKH